VTAKTHYRASWQLSLCFLGASIALAVGFAYATVRDYSDHVSGTDWAPLLPALLGLYATVGFFRTGVLGPSLSRSELRVPRVSGHTTVATDDIAGVFLGRMTENAYGQQGWVPVIWSRDHSLIWIRALSSLRETRNHQLLLSTHTGRVVCDMHKRVLDYQGSEGLLAKGQIPLTGGTPIADLISPTEELPTPQEIDAGSYRIRPHDWFRAVRGVLASLVLVDCVYNAFSVVGTDGNSLEFGFWCGFGGLMGIIAWRSLRIFFYSSDLSRQWLHIHSPLVQAMVRVDRIAGVGLLGIPWRYAGRRLRWVPVVWTQSTLHPLSGVATNQNNRDSERLIRTHAGRVAEEILTRVSEAQGTNGLASKNHPPPPMRDGLVVISVADSSFQTPAVASRPDSANPTAP
jgi:hypothetical protein